MRLLSTKEAAERLSVSPRRVRALVAEGRLKGAVVGGALVIREADLLRYAPLPHGRPKKSPS